MSMVQKTSFSKIVQKTSFSKIVQKTCQNCGNKHHNSLFNLCNDCGKKSCDYCKRIVWKKTLLYKTCDICENTFCECFTHRFRVNVCSNILCLLKHNKFFVKSYEN